MNTRIGKMKRQPIEWEKPVISDTTFNKYINIYKYINIKYINRAPNCNRVFYVEDHVTCKQQEFHFFSYLDSFYFFFCSDCCGQNFQNYVE